MEFHQWLSDNTTLGERTILNYVRTIDRFLDEYGQPTIENINNFISTTNRRTRTTYVKYAFRYYLEFIGKPEDYKKLVGVKSKPRKKTGVYISNESLMSIVSNIENETYRMVALIQYLTGARAGDVLRFSYNDMKVNDDETISLHLIKMKGEKEGWFFIPKKYAKKIRHFIETCGRKYSFLLGESDSFRKLSDNNYRYYYEAVKVSARRVGYPNFATHDFRRNFIEDVFANTKDIRVAQNLAHHSNLKYTMKYLKSREDEEKLKEVVEELRG